MLSQGDRWTARPSGAVRRFGAGMVLGLVLAPQHAAAQREVQKRESGGRGTIVLYQEARDANIVYQQPVSAPAREEASMKAPRAGPAPTPAAADAPARRAIPRRVAASSDPRGERP